VASSALVGLIAEIKFVKPQLAQAWLLTAGSLPLSAENQQKLEEQADVTLFVLDDVAALVAEDFSSAQVISAPAQLLDWLPQLQQLTVIGDGLSPAQWQILKAEQSQLNIDFYPAAPLSGLINMSWDKQIMQGEYLTITGQLQIAPQDKNDADLYELNLVDPVGNNIAQQTLRAGENFSFNVQPPTTGNWLYQLKLNHKQSSNLDTPQTLASEHVAVAVQAGKTVKTLIYQSAPSFETRQLRQWAASFSNPVSVVTQISKDKHLTQRFNYPEQTPTTLEPLTQQSLSQFDLVVMDTRALSTINTPQWLVLRQAIQQGLGLLILADQSLSAVLAEKDKALAKQITLAPPAQQAEAQAVVPNWPNSQVEQAIQAQALQLQIEQGKDLVVDAKQQALVSSLPLGLGQIGISLINNTYQWQTSGLASQYSHYWQYLFSALASNQHSAYWLTQSSNSLLLQNQKSEACALSQSANPQAEFQSLTNASGFKLNLSANLLQQERYCAPYWPQYVGWQELNLFTVDSEQETEGAISDTQRQYVYGKTAWMAWQQQHKQQSSHYHAKLSQNLAKPVAQPQSTILNKLWCWLIWLSACVFLWIERKQF
jgi:hypothetical protein